MADENGLHDPMASIRAAAGASGQPDWMKALSLGREGAADDPAVSEMRKNRRVLQRQANGVGGGAWSGGGGGHADISFATGRPRDPMFYWKQNNLPYDVTKPTELPKIRAYCRLLYMTHPIIASAIDVYAKYPLTGMELVCKDDALTQFYTTLFFEQLDYEDFLIDVGREYWTVGEAWPLGSFNETLGVWEDDELVNPDDVLVRRSPFLKEPRFEMRLPETIRTIIETRSPAWEFEQLIRAYPELKHFMGQEALMPVSNVLLKQLRFKGDTFNPRGVPILMRGFRAVMQEEMLMAAVDSVADRLFTPLLVAKLGASATDLGTNQPWIPTPDDISDFEESLDAALAGDFRVLIHHFALSIESVFGREVVPDASQDFDRLTERILQVFGLSKTMLSGAGQGETYAADAINRDLISQLLTGYQRLIKRLFRDRALVVAEAQEHYDYEERGGKRYPLMEEVLEVDEETGEQRIVEQPKLLVPDLHIKAMQMKDEQDLRQFYEALANSGVPISMQTRLVNVPIDLKDEMERKRDEIITQAVEAQEMRKETYKALKARNLPIPDDLKKDFEAKPRDIKVMQDQPQAQVMPGMPPGMDPSLSPIPGLGSVPDMNGPLAPTPKEQGRAGFAPGGNTVPMPARNRISQPGRTRPPESDEARADMPKAAGLVRVAKFDDAGNPVYEGEGDERKLAYAEVDAAEIDEGEHRLLSGPKHIGQRRFANIDKDKPLDEQIEGYAEAYELGDEDD